MGRCLFSTLFVLLSIVNSYGGLPVINGKVDLRSQNFDINPIVKLDGKWAFYWNQLLQQQELSTATPDYIEFAIPWNEQTVNGRQLGSKGVATYSLQVLLPRQHPPLALDIPAVFNSYSLWVNNQLVSKNGKIGDKANDMIPEWHPETVLLDKVKIGDTLNIVFQVANFQTTRGGAASAIQLGTASKLITKSKNEHLSLTSLILFFGIVGLITFVIGFIMAQSTFYYFAGVGLAFALRFVFSDLYPFHEFGWGVPWDIAVRIEYASIPFIVIWSTLFVSRLYPLEFRKAIKVFHLAVNALLILIVLLISPDYYSQVLLIIQIVALSFLIYAIYAVAHAVLYGRVGAWVSAMGILVACGVSCYNVFILMYLIDLNRIVLHTGYAIALILNLISLWYRTPVQLRMEEETLKYSDLFEESVG